MALADFTFALSLVLLFLWLLVISCNEGLKLEPNKSFNSSSLFLFPRVALLTEAEMKIGVWTKMKYFT